MNPASICLNLKIASVADLDGLVIQVDEAARAIGPESFNGKDVKDKAVLFQTGWSRVLGDGSVF